MSAQPLNREAVYVALWNMILASSALVGMFVTMARLLEHIDNTAVEQMPALYMMQQGETWERMGKGIPAKRTLSAALFIYIATTKGSGVLPTTLLNNAVDAIDALFNSPPGCVITLGGLVEHVYLAEGEVRYYEGLLQNKSPVVIPIRILVP